MHCATQENVDSRVEYALAVVVSNWGMLKHEKEVYLRAY